MSSKLKKTIIKAITTTLFLVCMVVYVYPIVMVFLSSVKTKKDMAGNPGGLPTEVTFEFIQKAWDKMNYVQSLFNTIFIVVITVLLLICFTAMASYAIARKSKLNWCYNLFLAGMMIPFQMRMIPLYKMILGMGLMNNLLGVVCIYLGSLAPQSVFLLTGFAKSVPRELEEAAYIDGAGVYRTFFSVVLPLLKSAIATVTIIDVFAIWNDYLMPMMFLQSRDNLTLTVTLANFKGMYFNDWSMIFAGVCLIVVPMIVIYLFCQKYIVNGITAGAVKG